MSDVVHLSYSIVCQILDVRLCADIQYFIGHDGNMYLILLGEPCNVHTAYNPVDICWAVLNNTMSQYYLCLPHIMTELSASNATMSQLVVPLMPAHGDHGAPTFDPSKPQELCHFFEELKFHFG